MKRLSSFAGSVIGIFLLGGLILVLALFFQGQSQSASGVFQSPLGGETVTCATGFQPQDRFPVVVSPSHPSPISSPLPTPPASSVPQRGSRVGSPVLVAALNPQIRMMTQRAFRGNRLVFPVVDTVGQTCLFSFDLAANRMEQIATLRGTPGDLVASNRYLVWTDNTYTPEMNTCPTESPALAPGAQPLPSTSPCRRTLPQHRSEMHVYDLQVHRESNYQLPAGNALDLDGDILVWQEGGGVYGKNLSSGQPYTITAQEGSQPKVAGEWVAYAASASPEENLLAANLHLFNLRTGEDRLLGKVSNQVNGGGYALDGETLAWVKISFGAERPIHELHVYNLATGQDRRVDTNNDDYRASLHLSDNLLVYLQKGWQGIDLQRDQKFDIFTPSSGWDSLDTPALFGNRLIWTETDKLSGVVRLYSAPVNRGS
jgi:hypothetical protein